MKKKETKFNWVENFLLKIYFKRMDRKRKRALDKYNKENRNNSHKF